VSQRAIQKKWACGLGRYGQSAYRLACLGRSVGSSMRAGAAGEVAMLVTMPWATAGEPGDLCDAALRRPVVAFIRAVNARNLNGALALLAPTAIHRTRAADYSPDGSRRMFAMLCQVFPDLRLDIRDQRVDGDRVVSHVVAGGTHAGGFLGRPASGEWITWRSVDVAEVDPGRGRVLGRRWDLWNSPELYRPLGHLPGGGCA
jgi:predicted ester cyclase